MDASESIAQNGISNYNFDLLNVGEVVDTISPVIHSKCHES